jgi:hydrogenase-1 operon protein HyaE
MTAKTPDPALAPAIGFAEFASTIMPPKAASTPPLVVRLVEQHGASWVDEQSLDAWLALPGDRVLFFVGDSIRFPECLDVAVVLPELQLKFPRRFAVGVLRRGGEEATARRFGVQRWPSLVFFRNGDYITVIPGMLDWEVYLTEVERALAAEPSPIPVIRLPTPTPAVKPINVGLPTQH